MLRILFMCAFVGNISISTVFGQDHLEGCNKVNEWSDFTADFERVVILTACKDVTDSLSIQIEIRLYRVSEPWLSEWRAAASEFDSAPMVIRDPCGRVHYVERPGLIIETIPSEQFTLERRMKFERESSAHWDEEHLPIRISFLPDERRFFVGIDDVTLMFPY